MTDANGIPGFGGEWNGGRITNFAYCALAPNAGPMTLDGTNTWVVGAPDSNTVAIIDPGPSTYAHWEQVAAELNRTDRRVECILLTHGHRDHSAGAQLFADETGCSVRALDPQHQLGGEGLAGGDVVVAGGTEIAVVSTPGHSSDSLSFVLSEDGSLLTGDTVLGRGTTVVAHPDGELGEYFDSLHRLAHVVNERELSTILPGHGPVLGDPGDVIEAYLAHRRERLGQVEQAVIELKRTEDELAADELAQRVVEVVYAEVPRAVWPAALLSVRAQLKYLKLGG